MKYIVRILHRAVELLEKKVQMSHFEHRETKVKVLDIIATIHAIIADLDSL